MSLVDIFQADIELPFETAFWEQPALLIDGGVARVLKSAPLSNVVEGFAAASSSDRALYMVVLEDGQRFDAAKMESLVEDAAFR